MKHRAKVAVITRTKDRNILLRRAVQSVLGQIEQDWVHVIVNDGGDVGSVESLLEEFRESYAGRLQLIHHEVSKGMEAASNAGVHASDSDYVVIHDDDDSLAPEFLSRCLEELSNNQFSSVKGIVTHTNQVFEKIVKEEVIEERRIDFDPDLTAITLPFLSEVNRFMPISFLFERSVFDEIGYFDESLPVIGDWEFNIRFLIKYDIVVIKENLANYHIRTNSPKAYGNTVTLGKDTHAFYRSLIINKHIRNDIQTGKMSYGLLMAQGDSFFRIGHNLWRFNQILEKMKELNIIKFVRKFLKK